MGVMRFLVHPPELVADWPEVHRAYISAFDGRIYPTRTELVGNVLWCRRTNSESGKLNISWPVKEFGRPVLSTASLPERESTYLLPLELARGKLSELRDQAAMWELGGMALPDAYRELQREAFHCFAHASAIQNDLDETSRYSQRAIEMALKAADILLEAYVLQREASIRRTAGHANGLIGCVLDSAFVDDSKSQLAGELFDCGSVSMDWRQIEPVEGKYQWDLPDQLVRQCAASRMLIRGGPLINLGPEGLPQWLAPWKEDFLNLPSFVCDYVETAVARYMGLIRLWEVTTAGNTGGVFDLGEEHRLALVARTLEAAVRTDSDSQFFIRVQQPWGEYQREGRHRLSPFQFVDALVRSNVGLSGVTLEINIGYGDRACAPRDLLAISRLINTWSLLGIQLHVNLACPSSPAGDARAEPGQSVQDNVWKGSWSEELQAEWFDRVIPLLLAKPAVTGVFLSQFSDKDLHPFPHGGLLRRDGREKVLVQTIRRLQHQR